MALIVLAAGCSAPRAAAPSSPSSGPPSSSPTTGETTGATTAPPTTPPTTTADRSTPTPLPPPYIASATWVSLPSGRSLRVRPTAAGRATPSGETQAWAEVRALAPDADSAGMEAQFACHWDYARVVAPDKATWNLEPWRPVVSADEMVRTRCNPGGAEE